MDSINFRIKLEDEYKKLFKKNNLHFFSYAWRENVNEFLSSESRYSRLIEWINKEIENCFDYINIFNPSDWVGDKVFTVEMMNTYLEKCMKVSFLINAKTIILDNKCTTDMRKKIEYALCKMFNIKYSKEFDSYDLDFDKEQFEQYKKIIEEAYNSLSELFTKYNKEKEK